MKATLNNFSPPVAAAIVAAVVAVITAALTALLTFAAGERRLRHEFRLEFAAERLARKLLQHRDWPIRSFEIIKAYFGGFDDDELRRILVRAGAIRFESKSGYELWALMERVPRDWLHRGLTKLEGDPVRHLRSAEQMKVNP
jgi:hypothetical protein